MAEGQKFQKFTRAHVGRTGRVGGFRFLVLTPGDVKGTESYDDPWFVAILPGTKGIPGTVSHASYLPEGDIEWDETHDEVARRIRAAKPEMPEALPAFVADMRAPDFTGVPRDDNQEYDVEGRPLGCRDQTCPHCVSWRGAFRVLRLAFERQVGDCRVAELLDAEVEHERQRPTSPETT